MEIRQAPGRLISTVIIAEYKRTMKSLLTNKILILLIRIFLGGIFIVASGDKFSDVQAFTNSIVQYRIISPALAPWFATILPALELLCGLCLIIGLYPRGCTLLTTTMLVAFTLLVVSAMARHLDISCGCFTQDPNVNKIGYQKITENIGLMVLSVWLLVTKDHGITLFTFFGKQPESTR